MIILHVRHVFEGTRVPYVERLYMQGLRRVPNMFDYGSMFMFMFMCALFRFGVI